MANTPSLPKLAEKFDAITAELANLDSAEPKIRADAEAMLSQLRDLPPEKLILPDAPGAEPFDKATDQKLRTLKTLRTRLELIPGCRNRLKADLATVAGAIEQLMEVEYTALRETAARRLAEEEKALREYFLPRCGGDEVRARDAAKAMLGKTEAANWKRNIRRPDTNGTPAEQARRFLAVNALFEAGKPVAAAA